MKKNTPVKTDKQLKRLTLTQSQIRRLESADLDQVAGGVGQCQRTGSGSVGTSDC